MTRAIHRVAYFAKGDFAVTRQAPIALRGWANGRLRYNAQMNQAKDALRQRVHDEVNT